MRASVRRRLYERGLLFVLAVTFLSGCGWVQTLRREVADDDNRPVVRRSPAGMANDYRMSQLPPPVTASDSRTAAIDGTPIDLSGLRAKKMRVKAQDFINDNSRNENSLWQEEGQTNYFFAYNKIKARGDLVTVVIEDDLRRQMVDNVKRLLPPEFRDQEIKVPGLTKEITDKKKAETAENQFDPADTMTGEIIEPYPNGTVRIRAIKPIRFKKQVRDIEVVAIVKGQDINEKDVVYSSKFFGQRVEIYK